ncbi:MAG: D-2-hydroxyacid dehydrogenase, partial [Clostridia bacterium]|nr:D-2-hydroxyacid dehydrogenase [Clostridia bacterium]
MKIVITDAQTVTKGDISLDSLKEFGELIVYPLTAENELIERLADADAVLCNKSRITREVIEACPKLKYIGLFATGYNNIDIVAAREHGVTVCNAGSYSTNSVAQQVFAFILHHSTNVANYDNFVQKGSWISSSTFSPFVFDMRELSGKTLGIFGFGSIGKAVSKIAQAFGMRVIVTTRTERETDKTAYGITYVDFQSLLSESDYLTVHCPLTAETEGLFDRAAFASMKKGAYFINTSRGSVLDESALADAVRSRHLSGAGVDVLAVEPMQDHCPLLGVDGITITPHVA